MKNHCLVKCSYNSLSNDFHKNLLQPPAELFLVLLPPKLKSLLGVQVAQLELVSLEEQKIFWGRIGEKRREWRGGALFY